MNQSSLPSDDLPLILSNEDVVLRRQLARSTSKCFYEACDSITQALLYRCDWQIASLLDEIGKKLNRIVHNAKIRIYSPSRQDMPFEISLDELLNLDVSNDSKSGDF